MRNPVTAGELARTSEPGPPPADVVDTYAELLDYVHADPQWKKLQLGLLALVYAESEFARFVQVTHATAAIDRRERELIGQWWARKVGAR